MNIGFNAYSISDEIILRSEFNQVVLFINEKHFVFSYNDNITFYEILDELKKLIPEELHGRLNNCFNSITEKRFTDYDELYPIKNVKYIEIDEENIKSRRIVIEYLNGNEDNIYISEYSDIKEIMDKIEEFHSSYDHVRYLIPPTTPWKTFLGLFQREIKNIEMYDKVLDEIEGIKEFLKETEYIDKIMKAYHHDPKNRYKQPKLD